MLGKWTLHCTKNISGKQFQMNLQDRWFKSIKPKDLDKYSSRQTKKVTYLRTFNLLSQSVPKTKIPWLSEVYLFIGAVGGRVVYVALDMFNSISHAHWLLAALIQKAESNRFKVSQSPVKKVEPNKRCAMLHVDVHFLCCLVLLFSRLLFIVMEHLFDVYL